MITIPTMPFPRVVCFLAFLSLPLSLRPSAGGLRRRRHSSLPSLSLDLLEAKQPARPCLKIGGFCTLREKGGKERRNGEKTNMTTRAAPAFPLPFRLSLFPLPSVCRYLLRLFVRVPGAACLCFSLSSLSSFSSAYTCMGNIRPKWRVRTPDQKPKGGGAHARRL